MKVERVIDGRGIFIHFDPETSDEFGILQEIKIQSVVESVGIMKPVYDSRYPELSNDP